MTENSGTSSGTPGVVVKKSRFSLVWLVPLVVILLGAGILYRTLRDAGVPVTLTFVTADGLEAGKTKIKYKDVEIGVVETIRVSDDGTHVVLEATIDRHSEAFLKKQTRFWVVRPRVTLQGISGLGTLLSGAYINVDPGEGEETRSFTGLETPPVLDLASDAREYVLRAPDLGSVSVGSPVFYRGFLVGEVLSYKMRDDMKGVEVKLFVRAPHHEMVFAETQFWDVSGINVTAGATGFDLKMASVESLLIGGIAFETSDRVKKVTPVAKDTVFDLHARYADIDQHYGIKRSVVLYFEGSLRGLSVGAPVEFRGIQVGEVTHLKVHWDPEALEFRMPITAVLEPERFTEVAPYDDAEVRERLDALVKRGMRGQLKSGSLLTGELFVDLVMEPDTAVRLVDAGLTGLPEMPTIPSDMEQMGKSVKDALAKLDGILTKVEALPLEEMVASAKGTLDSIHDLASSEELKDGVREAGVAMKELPALIEELRSTVKDADAGLTATLDQATKTLETVDRLLSSDSPIPRGITSALKELVGLARSIRSLTSYLARHPEALLKGKSDSGGK